MPLEGAFLIQFTTNFVSRLNSKFKKEKYISSCLSFSVNGGNGGAKKNIVQIKNELSGDVQSLLCDRYTRILVTDINDPADIFEFFKTFLNIYTIFL